MGEVIASVGTGFSMSLDGFVAGRNDDVQEVFAWMSQGDQNFTLEMGDHTLDLQITPTAVDQFNDAINGTGAIISGRRLFEMTQGWGGQHPLHAPLIVVTHRPAPEWVKTEHKVTFIHDGVENAVAQAKAIAGGRRVVVVSPSIVQQCLRLGLMDEIHIDLVPVLLGEGVRLFDHLGVDPVHLEALRIVPDKGVTHITFRVLKQES